MPAECLNFFLSTKSLKMRSGRLHRDLYRDFQMKAEFAVSDYKEYQKALDKYKNELKEYWVLNPNISWKGRLKDDSIFKHFSNTDISKLIS